MSHDYEPKIAQAIGPTAAMTTKAMVDGQTTTANTAPTSPDFAIDPNIKLTLDKWTAIRVLLSAAQTTLLGLIAQVLTTRTTIGTLRAQFILAGESFCSTIDNAVGGDPARIVALGGKVKGARAPAIVLTTGPVNVRVKPGAVDGTYTVRWTREPGAALYEAEKCADPPTEAGYAMAYGGTRARYSDTGTVGQLVWLRVRARGSATSAWSKPISYTIR
jgi:hypothetical protein